VSSFWIEGKLGIRKFKYNHKGKVLLQEIK